MEQTNTIHTIDEYSHFVGIKMPNATRAYFFGFKDLTLAIGDKVIVETIRGLEIGEVVLEPVEIKEYKSKLELKPIIRQATNVDIKMAETNKKDAKFAMEICKNEVERLKLDMNLISCEYTLDKAKVTFTYVADERVDFRELLKVLASKLHTRIDLRQIGSRDKAKAVGGLGICGLPLCCSTFLNEFDGISINRAKNQMLAINIPKLSGQCGKLICCLKYEDEAYSDAKKDLPPVGSKAYMDNKEYTITSVNIFTRILKVEGNEEIFFIPYEDLRQKAKIKFRREDSHDQK